MLPDNQSVPGLARLFNRMGEAFKKQMDGIVRLDADELTEIVSKRLALDDYGNRYFTDGLHRLIDSLNNDAELTFLGRVLQRAAIERSLENRLKFVEYKKKQPEIFSKALIPPMIILGLPRSGTTFLHRLLAQDPRNRGLYFWELTHPIPPNKGPDRRKLMAKIEYHAFRNLTRHFDHIHVIRDTEFEECIFLLTLTFQTGAYWMLAPVFSYIQWTLEADRLNCYQEYHQLLKIFQAQTPGRRLTLKAPAHTGSLSEIKRFIPDAILIQTHRHPVDVCNSVNSLVYFAQCNVVKRLDVAKMAECDLKMLENEIQRNLFTRQYHGIDVFDVLYEEILKDPLDVVNRIYAHHGIELTDDAQKNMAAFINQNPQHKHGKHKYRAEDFGMTDAQITKRFKPYMDRFGYSA